ncbi:hypothetical protein GCM10027343_37710 [Noviherbaspirillum agri]
MNDKSDWELVDDGAAPRAKPALRDVLKAMLGRHWRWKIAGIALVSTLLLALLITVTGVVALLLIAGAMLSIGIGKLRQWLGRGDRSLMRRP